MRKQMLSSAISVSASKRRWIASILEISDPQEWKEHLKELYRIEELRKNGEAEAPVLDFDEAPAEQKGNSRILFTKSVVWLPGLATTGLVNFSDLALTTSGIVHLPLDGKVGHVFYFGCS